jgi:hypothetical protein
VSVVERIRGGWVAVTDRAVPAGTMRRPWDAGVMAAIGDGRSDEEAAALSGVSTKSIGRWRSRLESGATSILAT